MSMNHPLRPTETPPDEQPDGTAQWIPDWFPKDQPGDARLPLKSHTTVYAVVVHDDEVHACRDIVEILEQVFGYSEPAAYSLTQEIAKAGRAVVWKGFRDDAEKKAEQARTFQPGWRRGKSVTAPQRVAEYVSPCTITVELAKQAAESSQHS